jgi:hypothetical protein
MDERHEQTKQESKRKRNQRYPNRNGCAFEDVREKVAHRE